MIIAKKYEVPDFCPVKCWGQSRPFAQGNLCISCPIFNCRKIEVNDEYGDEEGMFCMIEADDFREDWAKEWSEWFKGDMQDWPNLLLK